MTDIPEQPATVPAAGRTFCFTITRRQVLIVLALLAAAAVAAAVTLFVARDTPAKSGFKDAHAIQTALKAGGFDCVSWADEPATVGPLASGTCWYLGQEVTISLFDSPATRENAQKLGADMSSSLGVSVPKGAFVAGNAWMVDAAQPVWAEQVQAVLGGEIS